MIYLDNAATTNPKPCSVIRAVAEATEKYSVNPGRGGYELARNADTMIYGVRERVADFFGADSAENVVFTQNCTAALNIALFGLIPDNGHIVISPYEHNAVVRPLNALARRGVTYTVAECACRADDMVVAFESCIRSDTVAIVCTHASNVCGAVMPIKELSVLCRKYGLLFIVDAAQTAGVLPVNVKENAIDCLAVAAHKGLYAPTGAGLLITDSRPKPLIYGGTGGQSMLPEQPADAPERFESGTLNLTTIAGIGAGLEFVSPKRERIYSHEMRLIEYTEQELSRMDGITVYHIPDIPRVPLLSFNAGDMSSAQTASLLDRNGIAVRAGLHCAPLAHRTLNTLNRGTVRIAPSAFTTEREISVFLNVMRKISM